MLALGPWQIAAVEDGRFALDGGAMFGVVPRTLWQQQIAPDDQNRIEMALRCLLVHGQGRTVLVDTGMGDAWTEKQRAIYSIRRERTLVDALRDLGVERGDVTDVVLTHLHFDHAGGAVQPTGELTFPRAAHWVQRRSWEHAQRPSTRDRGSFRADLIAALRPSLLDGAHELMPGFDLLVSEGHTPGLQLARIHGGGATLYYCADLVPTAAHLKLAWGMAYDLQPLVVIEEKKALLDRALREDATLVFEHDPRLAACTLRSEKGETAVAREVRL